MGSGPTSSSRHEERYHQQNRLAAGQPLTISPTNGGYNPMSSRTLHTKEPHTTKNAKTLRPKFKWMAHLNNEQIQNNPTSLHLPQMLENPSYNGSSTTPVMSTIFKKKQRKLLQFGQKESDLTLESLKATSSIGADHNFKSVNH